MRPSEEPGKGEVLCTGMIGCSPTQRESNPNASACRATTATSTGCCVGNIKMPYFMMASLPLSSAERVEKMHTRLCPCPLLLAYLLAALVQLLARRQSPGLPLQRVLVNFPILHDDDEGPAWVLDQRDVLERVAVHEQEVSQRA